MKKNKIFLLILLIALSLNNLNAQTDTMFIADRFGNIISSDSILIPPPSNLRTTGNEICEAGIFRLHFNDVRSNTLVGFDDTTQIGGSTLGVQRQQLACQVFQDISTLINPAPSPYTSINDLGAGSFVEIEVKSYNTSGDLTLGTCGQYIITNSPGIVYGSVWQTINSGIDCWFGRPFGLVSGAAEYFHGDLVINLATIII